MKPLISIFNVVHIPTFYLVISFSLITSLVFLKKQLQKNYVDAKTSYDIVLLIFLFGFLGSRALHIIYEEPLYYFNNPWSIFKFWQGGFVFYGGLGLSALSVYLYLKKQKKDIGFWFDFFTPYLSFTYAFGRLGCFFEGCCFGKSCELPWAIQGRHPTQIYMLLAELLTLFFVVRLKKSFYTNLYKPGVIFIFWIIMHSFFRFLIEFLRDDDRGLIYILSLSQWISIVIISLSVNKIYQLKKK